MAFIHKLAPHIAKTLCVALFLFLIQISLFSSMTLAAPPSYTAISAGANHTLALQADGTVWAWGSNFNGQLGNNTTVDASALKPVQVHGAGNVGFLTGVTAVVAGSRVSMALKSDGSVWVWGLTYARYQSEFVPLQVVGLNGVTAIATGGDGAGDEMMALKSDGTVWLWGLNMWGGLGNGTCCFDQTAPVQVHGAGNVGFLSGVTAIATTGQFSMALKSDGSVWAWGINREGELGIGNNTGPSWCWNQPACAMTPVQSRLSWVAITTGAYPLLPPAIPPSPAPWSPPTPPSATSRPIPPPAFFGGDFAVGATTKNGITLSPNSVAGGDNVGNTNNNPLSPGGTTIAGPNSATALVEHGPAAPFGKKGTAYFIPGTQPSGNPLLTIGITLGVIIVLIGAGLYWRKTKFRTE
jgi:hypothetical protein